MDILIEKAKDPNFIHWQDEEYGIEKQFLSKKEILEVHSRLEKSFVSMEKKFPQYLKRINGLASINSSGF